jgi:Cd2+/Zn2+-exporting ATPase
MGVGKIAINLKQNRQEGEASKEAEESLQKEGQEEEEIRQGMPRGKIELLLTVLTAIFGIAAFAVSQLALNGWLGTILWGLAYAAGGFYSSVNGIRILREKRLDVNLLMIVAALGAAAVGAPAEGAILLFLFSLSNTLQSFALDRNRKAIAKLLDLKPSTAKVKRGSKTEEVPVEKLAKDDTVIVEPGERFPIDGEVISGSSDVNQAPITGESMPVHKTTGDEVFAGTVNGNGGMEIRVTKLAKDTTLSRIVQMVEEAQASKAKTQRMLDRFEQYYALAVIGGVALLISIPYFFFKQPFQPTFYRAMTLLVVASPCALVISTPASILSAIANGARNGVLFKGGAHLEKAATLKVIAFDKTGTLTRGKPRVATLTPLNGVSEEDLLRQVAAVEARSEHPLASAIIAAAEERKIKLPEPSEFQAIPGQGVEGRLEDRDIWVGASRLFEEKGVEIPKEVAEQVQEMEDQGQTVVLAYRDHQFLGLIGVSDTLREDAQDMIQALKDQGIERVVMLTGDNERVAAWISNQARVDEVHANLKPEDKVNVLKELQEAYGPVAMIGDGVNDAPALATASVGIAMGGAGTDVAMETADVVLMSDDLDKLPHAIGLAKQARKVVFQNLIFALGVIVFLIVSVFGIELPLPLGVVGHEGSTVLVVLNGLRLMAFRG